ncbi:MAG: MGMT family protein [Brooklawnia sp.]|jgi:methylated-DNA-protein-cysteine methyltransferase-like protein
MGPRTADELAEQVRQAVRAVPPGQVATYGDVAELVGCSPRQVGRIMATDAADTPWWRIVNASGRLPAHLLTEARQHWLAEGISIAGQTSGVQLRRYRVDPAVWVARLS